MITNLLQWVLTHPYTDLSIIIALIEIFLRLFPTSKNYSLLDKIHTFLNFILPNVKDKTAAGKITEDLKKVDDLLKFKIK